MKYLILMLLVLSTACSIPDIPNIPTGAVCMPDGYVMTLPEVDLDNETLNAALEPIEQVMDYVYDDVTGAVLLCEFTYEI